MARPTSSLASRRVFPNVLSAMEAFLLRQSPLVVLHLLLVPIQHGDHGHRFVESILRVSSLNGVSVNLIHPIPIVPTLLNVRIVPRQIV